MFSPSANKNENTNTSISKENNILIDDLSKCKNDLFLAQNELEKMKFLPDARKNIIELMFLMKKMENDIGKISNFSNYCVEFFALSSRIPVVQEYVLKYKDKMFSNNCRFVNNKQIIQMILPFQIQFLDQRNQEHENEKWYQRAFNTLRHNVLKIFVKSQITKSDIEIAVENVNYDEALKILNNKHIDKNDEFNKIYDAISTLRNMQLMLEGVYGILRINH